MITLSTVRLTKHAIIDRGLSFLRNWRGWEENGYTSENEKAEDYMNSSLVEIENEGRLSLRYGHL